MIDLAGYHRAAYRSDELDYDLRVDAAHDPPVALSPFSGTAIATLVLAVSGGADSMALLKAAVEARERFTPFPNLVVATVDHGLRSGSKDDAEHVQTAAAKLGVECHVLHPDWEIPITSVQATARYERLRLLRELALSLDGTNAILTAHTADDQAETIAMRMERTEKGAGDVRGWAGISPSSWLYGAWLARPFLHQRRVALHQWAKRLGIEHREDPSNTDHAFERVRVRAKLRSDPRLAIDLIRRGRRHAALRSLMASHAASIMRYGVFWPFLRKKQQPERLAGAGFTDAATLTLRSVIALEGGLRQLPPLRQTRRALNRMQSQGTTTLGRCLLVRYHDEVVVEREDRPSDPLHKCDSKRGTRSTFGSFWGTPVWDGRYAVQWPRTLGPWRVDTHHGQSPALFWGATAVPPKAHSACFKRLLTPYGEAVPMLDYNIASALADRVGLDDVPLPPFKLHWPGETVRSTEDRWSDEGVGGPIGSTF